MISGVTPEGFYVRGTKFPAEGFVSVRTLPDDHYRFEKQGQVLEGFRSGNRFRLGDSVSVKVHEVDLTRRALLFTLESNHTSAADAEYYYAYGKKRKLRQKHSKGKKIGVTKKGKKRK